jgi:hypothetical protein
LDLTVICGKAMEKDPDRRYQTMADLAADLRRHLNSEPILARPSGALVRLAKWARRNPTKSVAAGIAAVALVVISGFAWRTALALDQVEEEKQVTAAALEAEKEERARADANGELAEEQRQQAETQKQLAEANAERESQRADELQQVHHGVGAGAGRRGANGARAGGIG